MEFIGCGGGLDCGRGHRAGSYECGGRWLEGAPLLGEEIRGRREEQKEGERAEVH
jgi:hypothetical protein